MPTVARHHGRRPADRRPGATRSRRSCACCATHELPGVPVVNEGGRCVGIVTEADLVHRATRRATCTCRTTIEPVRRRGLPRAAQPLRGPRCARRSPATVADMMTADPVTVDADAASREAARADLRARGTTGCRSSSTGASSASSRASTSSRRSPARLTCRCARRARVDLAAIERNCARAATRAPGDAALCAVVKADGYGHGAVAAARAALAGGATWLAVATAEEAAGCARRDRRAACS